MSRGVGERARTGAPWPEGLRVHGASPGWPWGSRRVHGRQELGGREAVGCVRFEMRLSMRHALALPAHSKQSRRPQAEPPLSRGHARVPRPMPAPAHSTAPLAAQPASRLPARPPTLKDGPRLAGLNVDHHLLERPVLGALGEHLEAAGGRRGRGRGGRRGASTGASAPCAHTSRGARGQRHRPAARAVQGRRGWDRG